MKTYRVRLIRVPLYATTVEIRAASPEEAKERALATGEFEWELSHDGPAEVDDVTEVDAVAHAG
jgi:hypothetical protein